MTQEKSRAGLLKAFILASVLPLMASGTALGQGANSGTIAGIVESPDGRFVSGVAITLTSPSMVGARATQSDAFGAYIYKSLPPGEYTIEFKKEGFASVRHRLGLRLGGDVTRNATMRPTQFEETIEVTAPAVDVVGSTQLGANYDKSLVDVLPLGRTPMEVAALAPGLTDNTPNADQVTIGGNFAYDNLILVNGVDIADELFGTDVSLYIEDAIEETQVLTSGISAEYGRFGGGVVNIITKSGGNSFSGSLRTVLTNPAWRDETPVEDEQDTEREDKLNKHFEATLGGPIVKDRLWFFSSGRSAKQDTQVALKATGLPFTQTENEQRLEIKLTGNATPNHRFQTAFTKEWREVHRRPFSFTATPTGAFTGEYPLSLFMASYHGRLRDNLFSDWQYSLKKEGLRNIGGSDRDVRTGSPFIWFDPYIHYGPPYFDATDPEDRDNRQLAGSLSWFLSTATLGSHDVKVGFERYQGILRGGGSQSPTDYVFDTAPLRDASGEYLFDSRQDLIPVFRPGESGLEQWLAERGAELTLTTTSVYLRDRWRLNRHLAFNIGVRLERARGKSSGGMAKPVETDAIAPRLGATYDVKGDGRYTLQATFADYVGKVTTGQFGRTSTAGYPAAVFLYYVGPEGQGKDFAPGFDPGNYVVYSVSFPTANIVFDEDLGAPITREWTLQAGTPLGSHGWAKAALVKRSIRHFVEHFREFGDETTVEFQGVEYGTFSNIRYRNSDLPKRDYMGLQLMLSLQPKRAWRIQAHWTIQLENQGNFEGEAANQPGLSSMIGDYSEFFTEKRHYPGGRLSGFQRHKIRIFGAYDLDLGRFGRITPSMLCRYDSPTSYSLTSSSIPLTPEQKALDPGYSSPPRPPYYQTIFFAERGSELFNGSRLIDVAFNYHVPVFRTLRPWIKVEVRNVLNSKPLVGFNTSVRPNDDGPRDELGLPTTFVKGDDFGKGTSTAHYPIPREIIVMTGFRF